jgi:hypothetical protein
MSQEVLRKFSRRRRVEKDMIADIETAAEVRSFMLGEYPLVPEDGEPMLRGQITASLSTFARSCDLAKRRSVIVHQILEDPRHYPITEQNKGIVVKQFERILNFAKTLRNKRKLNPDMAKILSMQTRSSTKASILEQIN